MDYLFGLIVISFSFFLYGWMKDEKDATSNDDISVANKKNDALIIKCSNCGTEAKAVLIKCKHCGLFINIC